MDILRWYISRKYEIDPSKKDQRQRLDCAIIYENPELKERLGDQNPIEIMKLPSDNLDWWDPDENNQIEGWIYEDNFIEVIKSRNALMDKLNFELLPLERKIDEDMVFLQFIIDKMQIIEILERSKQKEEFPDLSDLLELNDSTWLDFTQQARNMSKVVYSKVLTDDDIIVGRRVDNEK